MLSRAADVLQARNRRRKAAWLLAFIHDHDVRSVLFVGSTGRPGRRPWENLVERQVAEAVDVVVFTGIYDAGAPPYVRADARQLPFRTGAFDLVFSNAVVEHVGIEDDQRAFVDEHARVGVHWALTTPNRWFPIESHTRLPVLHWSRRWRDQQTNFTRLLSRRELVRLTGGAVVGHALAPTFIAHGS